MILSSLDWGIILSFFVISLLIGLSQSKRAGQSFSNFFLAGGNIPWWLLGVSMVATTFSTDTPNLVSDIVRQRGVSGNWLWWAFLLTGMLTVFIYARLWRRSGVSTDLEFYEIRYSGFGARFLRFFRAIYLGVFFNIMVMASVTLAAIKIGGALLGLTPLQTILLAVFVTTIYSSLGGLKGVMLTDVIQFAVAMAGSIAVAVFVLSDARIGGLSGLIANPALSDKLSFFPHPAREGWDATITVFIIPIAVQWWSVYYPGAEPGGGGYIAQRMLSAKDEKHALGGTLLFNIAHYAIRPWPWIIVALASLVVFPDLESLKAHFPHIDGQIIKHDLAYPAMLSLLPKGLIGIVVASLMAAYMSTMSTHLNWGASYVVHDVYRRFIRPDSSERELVSIGRMSTVILVILASSLALILENALQMFQILLQIGAGTGLVLILRWFWWRINAVCEVTAMAVSFLIACYFHFIHSLMGWPRLSGSVELVLGVILTTTLALLAAFVSRPTDRETLKRFYRLIRPAGPGWNSIRGEVLAEEKTQGISSEAPTGLTEGILSVFCGVMMVYAALFGTGYVLYGEVLSAAGLFFVSFIAGGTIYLLWRRGRI